jgi:small-conductance mechanosensitive channel
VGWPKWLGDVKKTGFAMDFARPYTLLLIASLLAIPLLLLLVLWAGRAFSRKLRVSFELRFKVAAYCFSSYLPLRLYQSIALASITKTKGSMEITVEGAKAPLQPLLIPEDLLQALLAISIFFGALLAVRIIRKCVWDDWFERTQETEAPKFLSDICSAAIIGFSLIAIAKGVYHRDLSGLELGSTVSVAVIGFASQDLLGNLLSGIALQIGSPFRKGDWLLLEGKRLQVLEVNWRSTRMRSADNVLVDVPNKTIAGGTITNLSAPTAERASTINVMFELDAAPIAVKDALLHAAQCAPGVLPAPAPKVHLRDFCESGVQYEVIFWVDCEEHLSDATDAVRTQIWYTAKERGLRMPFPIRTVHVQQHLPPPVSA